VGAVGAGGLDLCAERPIVQPPAARGPRRRPRRACPTYMELAGDRDLPAAPGGAAPAAPHCSARFSSTRCWC